MKTVTIHTDGGCDPNPGKGGWAAILEFGYERPSEKISGSVEQTTNNRMELQGAIEALRRLGEPHKILIRTDSMYLIWSVTRFSKWKRKKKGFKNPDLVKQLNSLLVPHEIEFDWVRGHSGDKLNEECDQMAASKIETDSNSRLWPD